MEGSEQTKRTKRVQFVKLFQQVQFQTDPPKDLQNTTILPGHCGNGGHGGGAFRRIKE